MALSLAACGGSDSTTTAVVADPVTPVTPVTPTGATFDLTPLVDIASSTQALNGSLASTFRFTDGNETINGMTATMASGDTLLDPSTTDADVLNVTVTGATTITTSNIETINVNFAVANQTFTGSNIGTTNYGVTGSVAGVIATPATAATITLDGYTRVLELDSVVLSGTTALGSAESISVVLSGATHGATAAAQTGIALDGASDANLETLNIASNGTTANEFTLSVVDNETIGTIVTSGAADLTIRAAEALVDGKTITATGSTGAVNVSFDTASDITTNLANFTGVDAIMLRDSDATAAAATFNSVASNQNFVIKNSVSTLTVNATGATYSNQVAGADLELNGSSSTSGVTITTYNAQNIADLDLVSTGLASSTSTTAANTISNLDGDFTTIDITGDTSLKITDLDIEAVQTATTATTARAVTVDASAMTGNAFVDITAAPDTKVSYTITGTDGADTLVANDTGSTLNGGAGVDTLTGGAGIDTVNGGAGADHIDVSFGADNLTGGAGNDTYDLNAVSGAATVHTVTGANTVGSATPASADSVVVTIDGTAYSTAYSGSTATAKALNDLFIAEHYDTILVSHGVAVSTTGTNDVSLLLTGKADGTNFTGDITFVDNVTSVTVAETVVTGILAGDVATTITDFAAGDVIDTVGISAMADGYYEGTAAAISASGTSAVGKGVIVLTEAYASAELAEDDIALEFASITPGGDDGIFIFLNSTTGVAEAYYDLDLENDPSANALTDINQIFTFENITNTVDLAAIFSSDSFVI